MPLEIKELHIKVTVTQEQENMMPGGTSRNALQSGTDQQVLDKESIIAECVEHVMEILKEKQER